MVRVEERSNEVSTKRLDRVINGMKHIPEIKPSDISTDTGNEKHFQDQKEGLFQDSRH